MTKPTKLAHTLIFNNGAMYLFSELASASGLLTRPADVYNIGQLLEDHFTTLPKDQPVPNGLNQHQVTKLVHDWQRKGAHEIPCSENAREAVKRLVKAAVEKGIIPPGPPSLCILRQLGLAEDA